MYSYDGDYYDVSGLPPGLDFNDVKRTLMSVDGVREVHNLRIWSLTVNKCALAVHLALGECRLPGSWVYGGDLYFEPRFFYAAN